MDRPAGRAHRFTKFHSAAMHDRRSQSCPPSLAVRAVVFDLDGTLLDARAAVVDAVAAGMEEVLRRHRIEDVVADRTAIAQAIGLPSDDYYRAIVPARLAHLAQEVQAAATRHEVAALHRGEGRLCEGVGLMLDELAAGGAALALVSNSQSPYFHAARGALGLGRRFLHAECHGDLPPWTSGGKQTLLRRALHVLGVRGERACMVGDRHDDIAAGHALGCLTIGAAWGFGTRAELEQADHVAAQPLEVTALLSHRR